MQEGTDTAENKTQKEETKSGMTILWILVALLIIGSVFIYRGTARDVPPPPPEENETLTLQEAVGQMLMIGFRGREAGDAVETVLRDIKPGGVVLFDYDLPSKGEETRNIESPEQVRSLTEQLQRMSSTPLFIAVDAEGGYVNRLKKKYGFPVVVPSAQKLGAGASSETRRIAEELAGELRDAGINWNFAPVVDVNIDPTSPAIGNIERSFSDDPEVVAAHAGAFIDGLHAQNIIPAIKHFPGHGSASGDTHLGVTDVTDTYDRDKELEPYRLLIKNGYTDPVMTAHIVNRNLEQDGLPGTLSYAIITELLRNELGFDGVVISDDMQMGAIVEAYGLAEAAVKTIQAGVDIILLANQIGTYDLAHVYEVRDAVMDAVRDGDVSEEQIYTSANRILELKKRYQVLE